ncbi:lipopolysaccharide biosynthesis protein [Microbacterium gilvum]|uniref:Lipopolysaccharide biosynthesis protein n=2 Tax=Microbacterium gilvum TaxID=1336204 RepID=A0ABP9AA47_9MICO
MLDAADFGLVAMVTAIVGIGELIGDLGLSNAAIQSKDLSTQQRSNLFWISASIGLVVAGAAIAGAPLIAAVYGEPLLVGITIALSSTFLLSGISAQHKASLARGLRFRALAIVETLPPIIGGVVAIMLASVYDNYWVLIAQQIAQVAIATVLAWCFARWMPRLPRRTSGMRPLITYGLHLLGAQTIAYASRNIDTIVTGVRFGAVATGQYSRAFELVINPLNQLNAPSTRVATPVLSKLQDDTARYNLFLLRGQKIMLVVVAPVLACAIAVADPLIVVALGERWSAVTPIFQFLCVAGAIRLAAYATYWIALSKGVTKLSLYVNLVSAPAFLICILIGSSWGVVGIAGGFTAATLVTWIVSLIWYGRAAEAPARDLFLGAARVFFATVPAAVLAWFASAAVDGTVLQMLSGVAVFLFVYVLTAILVPIVRKDYAEAVSTAKLFGRR